jgi:hypothetical protein
VPIGTDTFVRNFVAQTCRNIIDDVEKLDGYSGWLCTLPTCPILSGHPTPVY